MICGDVRVENAGLLEVREQLPVNEDVVNSGAHCSPVFVLPMREKIRSSGYKKRKESTRSWCSAISQGALVIAFGSLFE